jgi:hypothetical protein
VLVDEVEERFADARNQPFLFAVPKQRAHVAAKSSRKGVLNGKKNKEGQTLTRKQDHMVSLRCKLQFGCCCLSHPMME